LVGLLTHIVQISGHSMSAEKEEKVKVNTDESQRQRMERIVTSKVDTYQPSEVLKDKDLITMFDLKLESSNFKPLLIQATGDADPSHEQLIFDAVLHKLLFNRNVQLLSFSTGPGGSSSWYDFHNVNGIKKPFRFNCNDYYITFHICCSGPLVTKTYMNEIFVPHLQTILNDNFTSMGKLMIVDDTWHQVPVENLQLNLIMFTNPGITLRDDPTDTKQKQESESEYHSYNIPLAGMPNDGPWFDIPVSRWTLAMNRKSDNWLSVLYSNLSKSIRAKQVGVDRLLRYQHHVIRNVNLILSPNINFSLGFC
jgi:hypothetical protein